jgi:trans-aconitate methyltransferase
MPLAAEWSRRNGYAVLDLQTQKKAGQWDGVSIPEIAEGAYGQIIASDVLQFLPPELFVPTINRFYDALAPGGALHVLVPHESGRYASMNPMHRIRFNENSFLYYARREFAQNLPESHARFDLTINETYYPSEAFKQHQMVMLRCDLLALKGQRHPGMTLT